MLWRCARDGTRASLFFASILILIITLATIAFALRLAITAVILGPILKRIPTALAITSLLSIPIGRVPPPLPAVLLLLGVRLGRESGRRYEPTWVVGVLEFMRMCKYKGVCDSAVPGEREREREDYSFFLPILLRFLSLSTLFMAEIFLGTRFERWLD